MFSSMWIVTAMAIPFALHATSCVDGASGSSISCNASPMPSLLQTAASSFSTREELLEKQDTNVTKKKKSDLSGGVVLQQAQLSAVTKAAGNNSGSVPSTAGEVQQDRTYGYDSQYGTIATTHYWDCNGQDCDSKTVPAIEQTPGKWKWQPQFFSASPLYAPLNPNDYGGPSEHGEKIWMTGAASDDLAKLLGTDDTRCGTSDRSPGGCGKCMLVQNGNAINSDWKVMVMKKHRCPPYSPGCEVGKVHLDLAVPGYDDVRYSTGNVCSGNPGEYDGVERLNTFGMTYDSSSSCSRWWDGNDNTQAGCDCSSVTTDYGLQAGCKLFTEWGWRAARSQHLTYQLVDCPAAFTSIISGAFRAEGPQYVDATTPTLPRRRRRTSTSRPRRQRCLTATSDVMPRCYQAITWAKSTGIRGHPEWYPGLTAGSPLGDFQNLINGHSNNQGCEKPACGV